MNQNGGGDAAGLIKETSTASFMADVVEASMQTPVIVDFWAPWCGPCKQLGPMLEKVVTEAGGAVRMVKLNIDENPEVAQQMRIQSIPAVFGFAGGRPVDGFAGAIPESQIRAFVDKLLDSAGVDTSSPIDDALAQAGERMEAEDFAAAAAIYGQILQHEPENVASKIGLARCPTTRAARRTPSPPFRRLSLPARRPRPAISANCSSGSTPTPPITRRDSISRSPFMRRVKKKSPSTS